MYCLFVFVLFGLCLFKLFFKIDLLNIVCFEWNWWCCWSFGMFYYYCCSNNINEISFILSMNCLWKNKKKRMQYLAKYTMPQSVNNQQRMEIRVVVWHMMFLAWSCLNKYFVVLWFIYFLLSFQSNSFINLEQLFTLWQKFQTIDLWIICTLYVSHGAATRVRTFARSNLWSHCTAIGRHHHTSLSKQSNTIIIIIIMVIFVLNCVMLFL